VVQVGDVGFLCVVDGLGEVLTPVVLLNEFGKLFDDGLPFNLVVVGGHCGFVC